MEDFRIDRVVDLVRERAMEEIDYAVSQLYNVEEFVELAEDDVDEVQSYVDNIMGENPLFMDKGVLFIATVLQELIDQWNEINDEEDDDADEAGEV